MPKILFTGGGSAGHVTPNLALIKVLQNSNWEINYAGSHNGIEKKLIEHINIPYFAITTGKLRRQLHWRNLIMPCQVILGIAQAFLLCRRLQPDIIFSKGGFVALPIVIGAWLNRIPIVVHESDLTPGLANRLSFPFARKICVTFPKGKKHFNNPSKVLVTGTPLREEILQGDAKKGLQLCDFNEDKPVLLVMGGGLGAVKINQSIRRLLPQLLTQFQIAHLCGKGKLDESLHSIIGYRQFEYVNDGLADLLACADIVVSRAGANSLYELLALRKPHLLIPLSRAASRGDQILNANYFAQLGLSLVLQENHLNDEIFLQTIQALFQQRENLQKKLLAYKLPDSNRMISSLLEQLIRVE